MALDAARGDEPEATEAVPARERTAARWLARRAGAWEHHLVLAYRVGREASRCPLRRPESERRQGQSLL